MTLRIGLVLLGLACCVPASRGHYHMLLPDKHSSKKDQEAAFTYQFGHPFEHQPVRRGCSGESDRPWPGRQANQPDEEARKGACSIGDKGKKVTGYRFTYKPDQRGDYVFVAVSPRIWMEEDKDFIQDTVKVVLHVQAQKGWDGHAGKLELVPLTRPYGLVPGMVFQAEMVDLVRAFKVGAAHPLAHALAEVELYNPKPPEKLPPEEHITRTVKLDRQAKLVTTLTDPGWWSLTVTSPHGEAHEAGGKKGQVRFRSTMWVFVDEPPPSAEGKSKK